MIIPVEPGGCVAILLAKIKAWMGDEACPWVTNK
jgi:hypothetical protein